MLIQLADNLVEKGHAHAAAIKQSVAEVDQRYKDFSTRMDCYKTQIEDDLGIQSDDGQKDLSIDRNSDPLLEEKIKGKDLKELNEEKRRSARRKEFVEFHRLLCISIDSLLENVIGIRIVLRFDIEITYISAGS